MKRLGNEGALTLPMGMALLIIAVSGLALWGLIRSWRTLAELQIRLDRCVGEVALELKSDARTIRRTNREIEILRVAIATAIEPRAKALLQAGLDIEIARQEWVRLRWNGRRVRWIARRGCGGRDWPMPLVEFPWVRDPPDALGPRALRLVPEKLEVRVQLGHPPRHAAALMKGDQNERVHEAVRWVPPLRPGFP